MGDRLYSVMNQRQTRGFGDNGEVIDVVEVSFKGQGNVHGQVEVPLSDFTPEHVDQLIRQRLDAHFGVAQLGES